MDPDATSKVIFMDTDHIKIENSHISPWSVEDVSEFLNYCCPECDFKDKNLQSFSDHALGNHMDATILFGSENNIIRPERVENKSSPFKCNICDYRAARNANLIKHIKYVHEGTKPLRWSICDYESATNSHLKRHIENVHEDNPCNFDNDITETQIDIKIESDEDYKNELKSEEDTSKDPAIDKPVTCELCWTDFSSAKLLKKHTIQNHTFKEDRTLKCCPHCDHKVKKLGNLKRHIESKHTDHAEKKYFCEKCNEGHIFKHSLNVHYYIKHSDFVCEVCGKAFKNKIYLNQHKYIKHKAKEKNDFMCETCGYTTFCKVRLKGHILLKHKTDKHHQCPHCTYKSPVLVRVRIHIDSAHPEVGEKKLFCNHCTKSFIYKDSLKRHLDQLKEKAKYQPKISIKCDYCAEVLKSNSDIKNHYKSEHPNQAMVLSDLTRYNCSQCTAFYFTDHSLKLHYSKKHALGSNPKKLSIQCDYCDEILDSTYQTKVHYKNFHPNQPIITVGLTKLKCSDCFEFYFLEQELEAHENIEHGTETDTKYCKLCRIPYKDMHNCSKEKSIKKQKGKRFPCSQCPRYFSSNLHLKDHVNTVHENRLDFACDQCGKKLASKKRLVQHIQQTHSKQVICEICNRKIANPAQLKRHKVFTHKQTEGAWFCQKCPKSVFFSKSTYELHLKDKH